MEGHVKNLTRDLPDMTRQLKNIMRDVSDMIHRLGNPDARTRARMGFFGLSVRE